MISVLNKNRIASLSKIALVILTFALIFSVIDTSVAKAESYKVQALRQTGKQLLEIGYEQYRRGMYANALASLEKAAKYKKYMSVADVGKLDVLIAKAQSVVGGKVTPIAVAQAETTIYTEVEPDVTQQPLVASTSLVDIYQNSVNFYNVGRYAEARSGFEQLVNTGFTVTPPNFSPADYLVQIDRILPPDAINEQYIEVTPVSEYVEVEYVEVPVDDVITFEVPTVEDTAYIEMPAETVVVEYVEEDVTEVPYYEPSTYDTFEPATSVAVIDAESESLAKESYIDVIQQKQRIQQSYTQAVVNDAINKASEYVASEEFSKAIEEISRAGGVVEKNKLLLGDSVYADYTERLTALRAEIVEKRQAVAEQKAQASRVQAQAAQEKLRTQQSSDRQKRIENLMANSVEYQEQQRYKEALAQVETLLAIDPLNREASRSKQMLLDILNLRRQLELKREMGREEEDLMYDNQVSMIPHADLITYPRNWQDISAKRDKKETSGLSPADIAVYEQLETLVDMTAIGPDTMLDEGIELIKNAVEPPLKLTVRWRDLEENAYIEPDTIVGMQGISGIPLGKALKELLESVSGGGIQIDYAVDEGIITVATKESLPAKLVTRVYDITELIGTPARFTAEMEVDEDISSGSSSSQSSDTEIDPEDRLNSAAAVIGIIEETIAPDSWFINGGEGTVRSSQNKIIVSQTPPIHEQVKELLLSLRESLGQQVSIETRFLFVTENFLEDIGIDMTVKLAVGALGQKGTVEFGQGSYAYSRPGATLVPGSLATAGTDLGITTGSTGLDYGAQFLDDLSVSFLLRATQAHRDAKMLTAPRITVLSSESAYIRVLKETAYVSDYDFENVSTSGSGSTTANRTIADPETDTVSGGVILNVTPTISADKKYVILEISTNYSKASLEDFDVFSETGTAYPISLPTREITEVRTRVSVPDGGTLLIGGQKLGAEVNKEAGVPGLSKVPIFGRLFTNRSKVKDQDILLVLVKPTIILQDEAEREYFAPLD